MRVKTRRRLACILGVLVFSVGALLGLALFGAIVWADFEAILFNPAIRKEAPLTTLRCPVMITKAEGSGTVTAIFTNPLQRPIELYIRAYISEGYVILMREVVTKLPLDPGETKPLQWTVTTDDAAFGCLILVKVIVNRRYPLPSRQGSCGILVVDVPYFTGGQIFALALVAGWGTMAMGAGLWIVANRPLRGLGLKVAVAMGTLAGSILVGTVLGLRGSWLPGGLVFVITLLVIGAFIGYFVSRSDRELI